MHPRSISAIAVPHAQSAAHPTFAWSRLRIPFGAASRPFLYRLERRHIYDSAKQLASRHREEVPLPASAVYLGAASCAGSLTALAMHPVFTIKTRLQLQLAARAAAPAAAPAAAQAASAASAPAAAPRAAPTAAPQRDRYTGLTNTARRMIAEEGFFSLYRGLGASLILVSHGAIQFVAYEHLKSALDAEAEQLRAGGGGGIGELGAAGAGAGVVGAAGASGASGASASSGERGAGIVIAGSASQSAPVGGASGSSSSARAAAPSVVHISAAAAGSKVLATLFTYPYQVVRSCMQQRSVQAADIERFGTMRRTIVHLWRTERLGAFYRGITAHIVRAAPQSSITLLAYEKIHAALKKRRPGAS